MAPDSRRTTAGRHLSSCIGSGSDDLPVTLDLLGPLRITVGGRELRLSGRRQRALLALFAMQANTVLPAERLADQLWDGRPPPGALTTLRSYIFHLRKLLDAHATTAARITTTGSGYRLEVASDYLDYERFRRLVASGHAHLLAGRPVQSTVDYTAALDLWRGQPVRELADHGVAAPLIAELDELRTSASEGLLRAMVEVGRHVEAIPLLESLVTSEPLREAPYELLMLALYRAGRSAEALDVHHRCRTLLRDQLGIDPSPGLDQLVGAILNRDPRLDLAPASVPAAGSSAARQVGAPGAVAVLESLSELAVSLQSLALQAHELIEVLTQRAAAIGPGLVQSDARPLSGGRPVGLGSSGTVIAS